MATTRLDASWNAGAAKQAIEAFVERVTTPRSAEFVPVDARVAVFDNDGTLWPEKPLPVELGFILQRLAEVAGEDTTLRERQPWKAAASKDYRWLGEAVTKHYGGDDGDVRVLIGAIVKAFAGQSVESYQAAATQYLDRMEHPTLHRAFRRCAYTPMIDLLRYLEANGFVNHIASGGDRDFMRVITDDMYGIPAERVVGSSNALAYTEHDGVGSVAYLATPDVFDDGPTKPVRIWSRVGRRPILACGNSNGDIPMLRFAGGEALPALRLLLLHDDGSREFAYTTGAEGSLTLAHAQGWPVISMRQDWKAVFTA